MNRILRLLLVDDADAIRRRLRRLLADEFSGAAIAEAATAAEAGALIAQEVPDLVVLDIRMPGENGLSFLRELRPVHPALPVIVLSGLGEQPYQRVAVHAGASSYLAKENAATQLIPAIRQLVGSLLD